jgi:hypothetical protein
MSPAKSRFVTAVAWIFIVACIPSAIGLSLLLINLSGARDLNLPQVTYDIVGAANLAAAVGLLRRSPAARRWFQMCAALSACCVLSLPVVGSLAHSAVLAEHGLSSDWFPIQTLVLAAAITAAIAWVIWKLESASVKTEFAADDAA